MVYSDIVVICIYVYSGYGIGEFSLADGSIGKNVIIFGVDVSSSVDIDNKNKDISVLDKRPTQGLDNTQQNLNILLILQN